MMRSDSAYVGAGQIRAGAGEIGRAAKTWATSETGATVLGVAGGIFAGEWLGSWLTEYFNVEDGWTKIIVKGIAKGALSFGLFFAARRTSGMIRLVLNGASAGALASIIGDVVGEYVAPGMLGLGGSHCISSPSSRNITIKANNPAGVSPRPSGMSPVGGRGQVITI